MDTMSQQRVRASSSGWVNGGCLILFLQKRGGVSGCTLVVNCNFLYFKPIIRDEAGFDGYKATTCKPSDQSAWSFHVFWSLLCWPIHYGFVYLLEYLVLRSTSLAITSHYGIIIFDITKTHTVLHSYTDNRWICRIYCFHEKTLNILTAFLSEYVFCIL